MYKKCWASCLPKGWICPTLMPISAIQILSGSKTKQWETMDISGIFNDMVFTWWPGILTTGSSRRGSAGEPISSATFPGKHCAQKSWPCYESTYEVNGQDFLDIYDFRGWWGRGKLSHATFIEKCLCLT